MEGYFDVISLHNSNFGNAVAVMGTAISAEQLELISEVTKRQQGRATSIVLLMDSDAAGQEAIRRTCSQVLSRLSSELDVRIGRLAMTPSFTIVLSSSNSLTNVNMAYLVFYLQMGLQCL